MSTRNLDIELLHTLTAWCAPIELMQELYNPITAAQLRTVLKRHGCEPRPRRRKISRTLLEDDSAMLHATGHINCLIRIYDRLACLPSNPSLPPMAEDRALITHTLDHYLVHFQDHLLDIDTAYLILQMHRHQATYRLHCELCNNTYWAILQHAPCPHCQPWQRRNCGICHTPIFTAGAGRPREYCQSPECRRAVKRKAYWLNKSA